MVDATRVLRFDLDGHAYGLLAKDVHEILRAATPAPLPGAPAVIAGLLNVRGALVPVYDIRSRFQLAARPMKASDHLILADAGRTVAIVVDRVDGLVEVPDGGIELDLPTASPSITGVGRLPDGSMVIVDLRGFLTESESVALDRALA